MYKPQKTFSVLALFLTLFSFANNNRVLLPFQPVEKSISGNPHSNPLSSFSSMWNTAKFNSLNTAKEVAYMTQQEKDVIWILNQVRHSPQLFLQTVLLNPKSQFYLVPSKRNYYFNSLIKDLKKAKSVSEPLIADEEAFTSAQCHAVESGKVGYVGHDRLNNCNSKFNGECCSYGYSDPMQIVMQLLIDNNVPSLGHRIICLSPDYRSVGVSIQSHTQYEYNAVIDFLF